MERWHQVVCRINMEFQEAYHQWYFISSVPQRLWANFLFRRYTNYVWLIDWLMDQSCKKKKSMTFITWGGLHPTLDKHSQNDDDDSEDMRFSLYLSGTVVGHTGRVIHGKKDLVLPLTWFSSSQPNLIFAETTCNVRDHFTHIDALTCSEITPW